MMKTNTTTPATEIEIMISPKCDLSDYLTVGLEKIFFKRALENPNIRITQKERPPKINLSGYDDVDTTLFWEMAIMAFPVFLEQNNVEPQDRAKAFNIIDDVNYVLNGLMSFKNFEEKWYIRLPKSGDPFGDTSAAEQTVQQMIDYASKIVQ